MVTSHGSTVPRAGVNVEALDLFVEVLSQAEAVSTGDEFYGRLCDAVCQLAGMSRALIFRYDPESRRVRAAGAHGMDLDQFADAHFTIASAPIAARALTDDSVIVIEGDLSDQFPPEYAALVSERTRMACAPMGAAGLAIGVILADRPLAAPPLDDAERDLLWTLGKAAALATVARIAATQAEKAHQLEQRIDLAREIHEGVVQRLFGVSMALDGDGDLPEHARTRCAEETQAALGELRAALQRPLSRAPRATGTTLAAEVERLALAHPELGITLENGVADVPRRLEPLAQAVLAEAVRNARKHARPTRVRIRVESRDGAFVLVVTNDGVTNRAGHAGIGLKLAALEAIHTGGVLEFGERIRGEWQLRLVVPDDD
jgi:signal transduction histidine kinase